MLQVADNAVFEGFGPGAILPGGRRTAGELALSGDASAARRLIRRRCPPAPGVYGMLDAQGQLIYLGKSKSLVERLVSYFTAAADAKAARIARHARRLVWEEAPHEFVALVRELELIRRWLPRFNVRGRPRSRSRWYLCLSSGPAPRPVLLPQPPPEARLAIGPLRAGRHFRRLVGLLADHFLLRTCGEANPIAFSDQRELFSAERGPRCLRAALGLCLAPCAGGCSRRRYARNVRAARAFLEGTGVGDLQRIEQAMHSAAASDRFEHAAQLRDTWLGLGQLHDHLERLREIRQRWRFVYPAPGYGGRRLWFLVDRGQIAAVVPATRGRPGARRCLAALAAAYGQPDQTSVARAEDADVLLLLSEWFRRYPDELKRTLAPEPARQEALRHGGEVCAAKEGR